MSRLNYKILKILFQIKRKNIAISFVNGSLNSKPSICSKLADSIKKTKYGYGYKLMDKDYTKLSNIVASPVKTTEEAFYQIEQAFGSVRRFFVILEAQRLSLESYSLDLIRRRTYIDGLILLYVSKLAKNWGKKFKQEYISIINYETHQWPLKNDHFN
jgi:hypothetical protein